MRYPKLAYTRDSDNDTAIIALAQTPCAWPSGIHLAFWQRWVYSCIHIEKINKSIRIATAPELSSSATELSSMAMKLSLGGDRALSLCFSLNQCFYFLFVCLGQSVWIHGTRGRNLKPEECKAEQYM
ncbi:hypothetical protein F2Q70_00016457 [Brassica cretica]|uniref:Uncharacterized protein n=1 Tax=Brassica cretica TaxID=69181 RepID=A0A8S9HUT1_BRACR|nr:hypothetical protein F2Q70_00016457 [Brassica cretica]